MLQTLPEEHRAKDVKELNLDSTNLPVEQALGLQRCVEINSFEFKMEVPQRSCTRRGMLSVLCSVYDRLGFLAPVVLPAKILLQERHRRNFVRDETIPQDILHQWTKWLQDLDVLFGFKVERCIEPKGFGRPIHAQLNDFSDAGGAGYRAVMMSKARVTPLKYVSSKDNASRGVRVGSFIQDSSWIEGPVFG